MFLVSTFMESFVLLWMYILMFDNTASGKKIYIDQEKTFSEALTYCNSRNGSLINPRHVNQTRSCIPQDQDVWIGEFTTLSAWMSLIGCFNDNSLVTIEQYSLNDADPAVCEVICREYAVFGLSGRHCVCMKNAVVGTDSPANNCNGNCNEKFPVGSCGGNSYYTVYKRDSSVSPNFNTLMNPVLKCASVACIGQSLKKTEENCNNNYETICRYAGRSGIDPFFNPWRKASELCFQQNDYLVYPVSLSCSNIYGTAQAWLSLFRNFASVYIDDVKDHTFLEMDTCTSVSFDGFKFSKIKDNNCNERHLPFFCEISSQWDNGFVCDSLTSTSDTTFHPTTTGVIIAAVVVLIAVIAVCIVVAVVICRYRQTQMKHNNHRDAYSSNSLRREEGENNGFAHGFVKETSSVSNIDTGYELASIPNKKENSQSLSINRNRFTENSNNDTGYEFLSTPKQTERDYMYVYSDTVEGDYDLLNRKDDRKIKNTDGEDTNIYSPTGDFEGTYDTTNTLSHIDDISDTYDHATVSNMVRHNNDDNDPYDHTNMC